MILLLPWIVTLAVLVTAMIFQRITKKKINWGIIGIIVTIVLGFSYFYNTLDNLTRDINYLSKDIMELKGSIEERNRIVEDCIKDVMDVTKEMHNDLTMGIENDLEKLSTEEKEEILKALKGLNNLLESYGLNIKGKSKQ